MRHTSILLAAASATLLTLSACSSTKQGTAATTTVAGTAVADTTANTTANTDTASTDTVPSKLVATGAHKDEPFCVAAVNLNNAVSPFNDSSATSDDFKKFFADVITPGIAEMRASAPVAVKAEVETLTSGYEQLGKVFESNNWDVQKTAADPTLQTLLNGQAFLDATSKLDSYCGFTK